MLNQEPRILKYAYIAVDPATSENTKNDCTAIVTGMLFAEQTADGWVNKIYILPYYVNKHMGFGDAIQAIIDIHTKIKTNYQLPGYKIKILIENAGQQRVFRDHLRQVSNFSPRYIELVTTGGQDKRSRIASACGYVQSQRVLFPEKGMEPLITQLLGFGHERFDDLADAFAMLVNTAMEQVHRQMGAGSADWKVAVKTDLNNPNQQVQGWYDGLGEWHQGTKIDHYRNLQNFLDKGLI